MNVQAEKYDQLSSCWLAAIDESIHEFVLTTPADPKVAFVQQSLVEVE